MGRGNLPPNGHSRYGKTLLIKLHQAPEKKAIDSGGSSIRGISRVESNGCIGEAKTEGFSFRWCTPKKNREKCDKEKKSQQDDTNTGVFPTQTIF